MSDEIQELQVTGSGVPIPMPTEEEIAKALQQVASGQVPDWRPSLAGREVGLQPPEPEATKET